MFEKTAIFSQGKFIPECNEETVADRSKVPYLKHFEEKGVHNRCIVKNGIIDVLSMMSVMIICMKRNFRFKYEI